MCINPNPPKRVRVDTFFIYQCLSIPLELEFYLILHNFDKLSVFLFFLLYNQYLSCKLLPLYWLFLQAGLCYLLHLKVGIRDV